METNNNYQEGVKSWHAKYAKTYDHAIDNRFRILTKYVKSYHNVLCVGCGTGSDTFPLAQKCTSIIGIDICKEMIDEARKRNKCANVTFQIADILQPPFPMETFDVIYSFSTFYYIKEQKQALQQINQLLKPNGTLIFDIGNKHSINNTWDRIIFKVPTFNTTTQETINNLRDTGFKKIKHPHHYQLHPWNRKEVFNQTLKKYAFRILMEAKK